MLHKADLPGPPGMLQELDLHLLQYSLGEISCTRESRLDCFEGNDYEHKILNK